MSVVYKSNTKKVIAAMINGNAAATIIAPVALDLNSKIKAVTPTLTGETRDSIKATQHSKFGYTIATNLIKAIYIEYGTEDTPAFGMFRKTFDSNAVAMAKRLETDFKALVENVKI